MATIVLVHGAFHGGWCWRETARLLRAEGYEVYTPTLTGLADRSHLLGPAVDLDVHIADIVNLLRWEELSDVVLVGHSYGGVPVTGAADACAERLAALVYLDAYTPANGQSAQAVRSVEPGFVPLAEPTDGIAIPPPPARVFGLEGALAAQAERLMTPHPLATITQPIRLTGAWRRVPRKLYIRAAQFPAPYFDRYYESAETDPEWAAVRSQVPHDVMLTDPAWLIEQMRRHVL